MATPPVNSFTVGTDLQSCVLYSSTGASIDTATLGHLLEVNAQQQTTKLTQSPATYGGLRLHRNIYHDFACRLVFARYSANLTTLITQIMQRAQQQGYETYFSIFGVGFNPIAAAEEEFLFQNCVIDDHDFGTYTGTTAVDQSFAFRCQSLILTGSIGGIL
jgi:hypothetical protein